MSKRYIKTYDKKKDKNVTCGYVEGDTYTRSVRSKHFMYKYNGYGIQYNVMEQLIALGVRDVVVKTNKGISFSAQLRTWADKGKVKDEGSGKQVFLDIKFMEKK